MTFLDRTSKTLAIEKNWWDFIKIKSFDSVKAIQENKKLDQDSEKLFANTYLVKHLYPD